VYQVGGLCSVHSVRPGGCRLFFCDPTADEWQQLLYERQQRMIRRIHDKHGLPYRYMEWLAALQEARAPAPGAPLDASPSGHPAGGAKA
jgi:Fe-S-cluster containining protein